MPLPAVSTGQPVRTAFHSRHAGLLALLLPLLSACGGDGAGWSMPPPPVSVQDVKAVDVPMTFAYAARISDSRQVEVRARVTGILQQRAYTEGAYVKKGELLFVIDPAPLSAEASAAAAQLQQAKVASEQADRDAARAEDVFVKGLISARDRDLAVSQRDQARAALERAQAEATRRDIDLGYTRVTAPVSGITRIETKPEGSYVSPAAEESLLTTITPIDPVTVDFSVSESDNVTLRRLLASGKLVGPKRGAGKAKLSLYGSEIYPLTGKVEYLDVVLDPQTGTLLGRAEFANPRQELLPGQFVRLILEGYTLKNVIVVPEKSVQQGPQGAYVYVLGAENKADVRPVNLGLPVNGGRVVESGLASGDRVILDNLMKVRPGAPVEVLPPAAAVTGTGTGTAVPAKAGK